MQWQTKEYIYIYILYIYYIICIETLISDQYQEQYPWPIEKSRFNLLTALDHPDSKYILSQESRQGEQVQVTLDLMFITYITAKEIRSDFKFAFCLYRDIRIRTNQPLFRSNNYAYKDSN